MTDRYRVAFEWLWVRGAPAYECAAYARWTLLHNVAPTGIGDFWYSDAASRQRRITGRRTGTHMPGRGWVRG